MKRAAFLAVLVSSWLWPATRDGARSARAAVRVPLALVTGDTSDVTDMSLAQVRRLFTGGGVDDRSGRRLVPLNHAPNMTDRVAFDRAVLGLSPEEVSRFWIDRKIRGQPGPPRSLDSAALLLRVVLRLPGAVSYVRFHQLPRGMHVVRVDGKLPHDPAYPLYIP